MIKIVNVGKIIFLAFFLFMVSCNNVAIKKIELSKVGEFTLSIPTYVDINSLKFTSEIQIVKQDTFFTFIDQVDSKIYIKNINENILTNINYQRYGPNQIKSEPYMVKIFNENEILILCQKHIVFSKLEEEVLPIKEFEITNDTSILYYGNSYWYRQFIGKENVYFFKFNFNKGKYTNKLTQLSLSTGQQSEIEIPIYYANIMNDEKSTGGLMTSILLPQISLAEGKVIYSSWYSNKAFVKGKKILLENNYDHIEQIKSATSNDRISDIGSEEGENGTLIYDPSENIFIREQIEREKETGLIKNELCFFDMEGNLLNCIASKGMLKSHSTGHLYFLDILEAEDKANIVIYNIVSN